MLRVDAWDGKTKTWLAGIDYYWHVGPAVTAARAKCHKTGHRHRVLAPALLPGDIEVLMWEATDGDLVKPTKTPAGFDLKAAAADVFNTLRGGTDDAP